MEMEIQLQEKISDLEARPKQLFRRKDLWYPLLLFISSFGLFNLSPIHPVADSKFSMLVSQSLIDYGTFELSHYYIPRNKRPKNPENIPKQSVLLYRYPYQIELINRKFYYFFPPGTSVLSVPFVLLSNAFGIEASNEDGSYNFKGEQAIQRFAAAFLMAALGVIFYQTARLLHNSNWSLLLSTGALFGTQIFSTASRGMQSHTWNVLLAGFLIYVLASHEIKKTKLNPILIGTILSLMYFVRPTSIVPILATSLYYLIRDRRTFFPFVLTGLAWFAGFILYSMHNFGQPLPNYYSSGRLVFQNVHAHLAGNLISPSRGLIIYVPILIFVIYQLVRNFKGVQFKSLLYLSFLIITGHLFIISTFPKWWGGHCYGPRLSTDLVPWFFLIAILAIDARSRASSIISAPHWRKKAEAFAGGALLVMSILINAYPAMTISPWGWNSYPDDIDFHNERLWDWKNPQFLFRIPN